MKRETPETLNKSTKIFPLLEKKKIKQKIQSRWRMTFSVDQVDAKIHLPMLYLYFFSFGSTFLNQESVNLVLIRRTSPSIYKKTNELRSRSMILAGHMSTIVMLLLTGHFKYALQRAVPLCCCPHWAVGIALPIIFGGIIGFGLGTSLLFSFSPYLSQ